MFVGYIVEVLIYCDGVCDEDGVFYVIVMIVGQFEEKCIYGVDLLQVFVLGCMLIENLMQDWCMLVVDVQILEIVWQISFG